MSFFLHAQNQRRMKQMAKREQVVAEELKNQEEPRRTKKRQKEPETDTPQPQKLMKNAYPTDISNKRIRKDGDGKKRGRLIQPRRTPTLRTADQ
jgi:hypothetical protein